jgi:hypothetical protein
MYSQACYNVPQVTAVILLTRLVPWLAKIYHVKSMSVFFSLFPFFGEKKKKNNLKLLSPTQNLNLFTKIFFWRHIVQSARHFDDVLYCVQPFK